MLELWGCVTDLDACFRGAVNSIPLGYYIGGAFLLGMIVGAVFRWGGVIAFLVGVVAVTFGRKRSEGEPMQYELPFEDTRPPFNKPKKRRTIKDLFKGF